MSIDRSKRITFEQVADLYEETRSGYPEELIRAFDHDGAGLAIAEYADGVDEFIDQALADFPDYDQVYLVGHSRGTSVSRWRGSSAKVSLLQWR